MVMDFDNLQQNLNTRVVFKEPRGMIRWLQLFFAILAFATIVDFSTIIGITITCPSTNVTTGNTTVLTPGPTVKTQLAINYPFDFSNQIVNNSCPNTNYTYTHMASLGGSPQFFVMTGVLSLLFASVTLVVYLMYSSTYDSLPVMPVADLIVSGILSLFWFIASISFSSSVGVLKSTISFEQMKQTICPPVFTQLQGVVCDATSTASWKGLNVGLMSGFTSFLLWGAGLWFIFKETHFHTPRNQFGPTGGR